jgi:hypothetical protein
VVDGSGLENRHTRKGIRGSNPFLSATQSGLQRNFAALSPEIRERCPFFAIIPQQIALQRTDCSAENGVTVPAFLRGLLAQSGFKEGIRRMQYDQKQGIQPQRVDFCRRPGKQFRCFP